MRKLNFWVPAKERKWYTPLASRLTELTSITLQLNRDLPVGHCVSLLKVPTMNRKLCHYRVNKHTSERDDIECSNVSFSDGGSIYVICICQRV